MLFRSYQPETGQSKARKADYAMVDVIPVSDPNSSTMAQRVVQYQAVFQMSQSAPQIYDLPYLHRQMIEVLGVKNADKIVPTSEDQKPRDPVSENMSALVGKPMKAFIYQDHDAHIAAHTSFMQDPMIAASIGQNPMAQQIMGALQAHIAEHLGFSYRKQIEERLGVTLPPPDEELPPEIETQLSRLIADAGKQVAQAHQQQAAQQQAQQQAADPLFQLEQQKVQVKQAEVQAKAQKLMADVQLAQTKQQTDTMLAAERLKLERERVQIDAMKEGKRIQSQEKQAAERTKLDALKVLATPKSKPPASGKKE